MTVMAVHVTSAREGLLMVSALLVVIGVTLIALAPAKPSGERVLARALALGTSDTETSSTNRIKGSPSGKLLYRTARTKPFCRNRWWTRRSPDHGVWSLFNRLQQSTL